MQQRGTLPRTESLTDIKYPVYDSIGAELSIAVAHAPPVLPTITEVEPREVSTDVTECKGRDVATTPDEVSLSSPNEKESFLSGLGFNQTV